MPHPIPLAYAALAASTVTTLQPFVSGEAWPSADFHVEIIPHGAGNRDHSQTAAAAGAMNPEGCAHDHAARHSRCLGRAGH